MRNGYREIFRRINGKVDWEPGGDSSELRCFKFRIHSLRCRGGLGLGSRWAVRFGGI